MVFEAVTAPLAANLNSIILFILIPVALSTILLLIKHFYAKGKGVQLDEEFYKKSFLTSLIIVFGWIVYIVMPKDIELPLQILKLSSVLLVFNIVMTIQYAVYVGTKLISPEKSIVGLGIGAGMIRSTLAASVMAPIAADNEEQTYAAAAAVMVANTVAILRNLLIIFVVGIFLGLFILPPIFFLAPMFLMLVSSGIIASILLKKSKESGPVEFDPLSYKGTTLFMLLFVATSYLAFFVLQYAGFLGFYTLSGIAGYLYGAAHLFVIVGLYFANKISLDVGLVAAIFVTAGSFISDSLYAYLNGAEKLTKILIVVEIIPVAIGLATLFFLYPLF